MITPEEIRLKAERLYRPLLVAWLNGEETFFPRVIPGRKKPDRNDYAGSIAAARRLREGSKRVRGFGYTLEERERNSRAFARNPFPERIVFETRDDLLRLIGRQREFDAFAAAVERLRAEFPTLEGWLRANPAKLIRTLASLDGLLHVLRYLRENPRPGKFARELPLPVHTKFIEDHKAILREWLDLVLPPHAIDASERHFERRFGLRYLEPHLCVKLLDPALRQELAFPCEELSIPLHTLGGLPVRDVWVVVVENKRNLFTFPPRPRGLALEGRGDASADLRYVGWLRDSPLLYWGDLDAEGFEALSTLRALFPQTRSFLMDPQTIEDCLRDHLEDRPSGTGRRPDVPPHLTEAEQHAFLRCRDENLRIEQERIPQSYLIERL